jgi:hypothetical protein
MILYVNNNDYKNDTGGSAFLGTALFTELFSAAKFFIANYRDLVPLNIAKLFSNLEF